MIPVLAGQLPLEADVWGNPALAVVSQSLAQRFWPDGGAIGRQLTWGDGWWTIVGVVGDVKHFGLDGNDRSAVYMPHMGF